MPRLFLGNFEFEHRLAEPKRQLPTKLERINAELASSWLAIADDGDYLWTPQPIKSSFFENAVSQGLPKVVPVVSFDEVPSGIECVPWGWTDDIRRLCDKQGWSRNDPPAEAVAAANSRRMSAALEREWRVGLDFSGEVQSITEVERFIERHGAQAEWLIKAEFGMSGRERIVGMGSPTDSQKNWIQKRLAADGVVFFEPWVERIDEVGIQIHIPQAGEPELIQVVPLLIDSQGQYVGSVFQPRQESTLAEDLLTGNSGVEVALRAARRLQDIGYFGPLGIDAMRYRAADHSIRIRPLQDVNARWTMGRLSLGWKRLLKRGESGRWMRVSARLIRLATDFTSVWDRFRSWLQLKSLSSTGTLDAMAYQIIASGQDFDVQTMIAILERCMASADDTSIVQTVTILKEQSLIKDATGLIGEPPSRGFSKHGTMRRVIVTSPEAVGNEDSSHRNVVILE